MAITLLLVSTPTLPVPLMTFETATADTPAYFATACKVACCSSPGALLVMSALAKFAVGIAFTAACFKIAAHPTCSQSGIEDAKRFGVQRGGGGDQHSTSRFGATAVQPRNDAAGALNDRDQRDDVIGLE